MARGSFALRLINNCSVHSVDILQFCLLTVTTNLKNHDDKTPVVGPIYTVKSDNSIYETGGGGDAVCSANPPHSFFDQKNGGKELKEEEVSLCYVPFLLTFAKKKAMACCNKGKNSIEGASVYLIHTVLKLNSLSSGNLLISPAIDFGIEEYSTDT